MKQMLAVALATEQDVVTARQRARQIAQLLGFGIQEQTRVATAVSEVARNAYEYAGGGRIEFGLEGETVPQLLIVVVKDKGPGIAHLDDVLAGRYRSQSGMGMGLVGAQRLMDQCRIDSVPGKGTTIRLTKMLPRSAPRITVRRIAEIADALIADPPQPSAAEVQQQNRELLQALSELRERQDELLRVNQELEDTNRGVVALYAELDEKADHLRRADEMKSRFLSNMSHEFRTPLNSIRALSRLLLDRTDGELSAEQDKQVRFVLKAAEDLTELVNDLLDLAKIEAGKTEVRPIEFEVSNLFSALRGMLRPLLVTEAVTLVFEEAKDLPPLHTDEGKVSQIVRNFLSNALKFTERGEVRASASLDPDGRHVVFTVTDTGIGIAPEDQTRIFEEFSQIDNPLQRRHKGTGLGLPLCRRLATLLGGEIQVQSTPGVGSRFSARLPVRYSIGEPEVPQAHAEIVLDRNRVPILLVEDEPETVLLYEKYLRHSPFQPIPARSLREAREALARYAPRAVVLDIRLKGEDSWDWLAQLKGDARTRSLPVLVASTVEDEGKGRALGADAYFLKPVERATLLEHLCLLTSTPSRLRVLVVDDDEATRYLVRKALEDMEVEVLEAGDGATGLGCARELSPSLILLDLKMPRMSGEEVLRQLRADPHTAGIRVVIISGETLDSPQRERLAGQANELLTKASLSAPLIRELVTRH